jgi:hypothetical protein
MLLLQFREERITQLWPVTKINCLNWRKSILSGCVFHHTDNKFKSNSIMCWENDSIQLFGVATFQNYIKRESSRSIRCTR